MQQQDPNPGEAGPAIAFNPFAPGFDQDPYPAYEELREKAPVHYWEEGRGFLVSRFDDIMAVIRDDRFTPDAAAWELASTMAATIIPAMAELSRGSLFSLSNKDHARVRKLLSPALTPRAIERLRPDVQRIVDASLAAAEGADTFDVARHFAEHIPARVIAAMLKIPAVAEGAFERFAGAVVQAIFPAMMTPEIRERLSKEITEGVALVREVIDERRRSPLENDILTTLIQTEEQGDKLNADELLSLVAALVVGGSETTVHLIDFTVLNLLRRPEVLEQVKAEPELLRGVLDEVLRFDFFGKAGITRYALEDVEVGGVAIKKGQMVMLMLGAGLRDHAAFNKADVFDIRRQTNASIAFGNGAHYCIGANLARLEGQVAVGTLLSRFPEMKLEEPPVFGRHPVIRKMESLKVRLRPSGA